MNWKKAQQLFQRDAQTITLEALESVKAALASSEIEHKAETKKKAVPRKAAGQAWEDPTLADWPENDSRLFCGDLGNEVNDDVLSKAFSRFPSFNMARVSYLNSSTFYMSQPSLVRIIETLICLLVVVAFGELKGCLVSNTVLADHTGASTIIFIKERNLRISHASELLNLCTFVSASTLVPFVVTNAPCS
ncbi:uncharacterized protein LOC113752359 [Coffea eugenioides]|uniref:uncharacterized protein LOC113752359 n=1 Tax=Coffea eugenioides TaxID=49369 RepID=UPI000F60BAE7|nr:uncharacterized protein LOC113752359 [Coffea eugenioides]